MIIKYNFFLMINLFFAVFQSALGMNKLKKADQVVLTFQDKGFCIVDKKVAKQSALISQAMKFNKKNDARYKNFVKLDMLKKPFKDHILPLLLISNDKVREKLDRYNEQGKLNLLKSANYLDAGKLLAAFFSPINMTREIPAKKGLRMSSVQYTPDNLLIRVRYCDEKNSNKLYNSYIEILDAKNYQKVSLLDKPGHQINWIRYNNEKSLITVYYRDQSYKLVKDFFYTKNYQKLDQFEKPGHQIFWIDYNEKKSRITVTYLDQQNNKSVENFDAENYQKLDKFEKPDYQITSTGYKNQQNKKLIEIFDPENYPKLYQFDKPDHKIESMQYSPDKSFIKVKYVERDLDKINNQNFWFFIEIFDPNNHKKLSLFQKPGHKIWKITYNHDTSLIKVHYIDKTKHTSIELFDLKNKSKIRLFDKQKCKKIKAEISPDNSKMLIIYSDKTCRIFDLCYKERKLTKKELTVLNHLEAITVNQHFSLSKAIEKILLFHKTNHEIDYIKPGPDSSFFMIKYRDKNNNYYIEFFDTQTNKRINSFDQPKYKIIDATINPSKSKIMIHYSNKTCRVFDLKNRKSNRKHKRH